MRRTETGPDPERRPQALSAGQRPDPARGLVRLLGFVLGGAVEIEGEGEGLTMVRGRLRRPLSAALLSHAVREGLVARKGRQLVALPPARPLLKRLLSGAGNPHYAQHAALSPEERLVGTERRAVTVNRLESVLGALALLKDRAGEAWFPPETLAAGERLLADFTYGGLQPRLTARYEPRLSSRTSGRPGGGVMLSDSQIDARRRLNAALAALGPDLSGAALDVCCFGKGLEQVERERQWPARSAKLMLKTALQLLARHYGLTR